MLPSSISPGFFPKSFSDLLNYMRNMPNYHIFDENYKWNLSYFKVSSETPQSLPALCEIESFWLKKTSLSPKPPSDSSNPTSIIKEDTFLLWLLSVLEEFWQKTVFELVIVQASLKFIAFFTEAPRLAKFAQILPLVKLYSQV